MSKRSRAFDRLESELTDVLSNKSYEVCSGCTSGKVRRGSVDGSMRSETKELKKLLALRTAKKYKLSDVFLIYSCMYSVLFTNLRGH